MVLSSFPLELWKLLLLCLLERDTSSFWVGESTLDILLVSLRASEFIVGCFWPTNGSSLPSGIFLVPMRSLIFFCAFNPGSFGLAILMPI
ncbi:uncharacterized protein BCR38DRAFT_399733 [Pseudomassariella vexata]|uniref:Uncharacterized protein n=1 Tax=Pseudomassariella vexata TaxID=1141098 RepID=A0A1Y2DHN2_9PEZI|nr:uncharacterized protein BCR38DRAFT_399733 [Pseudomassariella vexata]ORY58751.1 hypothetical protein BCR38DRAFT_399733 [Pseudomassariella vexata]